MWKENRERWEKSLYAEQPTAKWMAWHFLMEHTKKKNENTLRALSVICHISCVYGSRQRFDFGFAVLEMRALQLQ